MYDIRSRSMFWRPSETESPAAAILIGSPLSSIAMRSVSKRKETRNINKIARRTTTTSSIIINDTHHHEHEHTLSYFIIMNMLYHTLSYFITINHQPSITTIYINNNMHSFNINQCVHLTVAMSPSGSTCTLSPTRTAPPSTRPETDTEAPPTPLYTSPTERRSGLSMARTGGSRESIYRNAQSAIIVAMWMGVPMRSMRVGPEYHSRRAGAERVTRFSPVRPAPK